MVSAKEFSPLTGENFGQKYDPEPWGQGINKPAQQSPHQDGFYNEPEVDDEDPDDVEKRGTKNDRLRGLRRLSRLYGELGLDKYRPVKKTPETADDMYRLDDKRDAGPHAWYGTGMFGKRSSEENRGRWRIRSPRPGPYNIGLFGKRNGQALSMEDIANIIESIKDQQTRR
ncbi:uncharacterized protein [Diadema antillarum]|uniref:uncharacterized protein n=1 Tax=Diadema antillarum TaxID=105358 RepID=UPI003A84F627